MTDILYPHRLTGQNIRLLELLPGSPRRRPRCRLFQANLDEEPEFEAISYVWGNPYSRRRIICNGKHFSIGASLGDALHRIRYPERSRIVWADALCINQSDTEERNHQVQLMRAIYSQAQTVLVRLMGYEDDFQYRMMEYAASYMGRIEQYCQREGLIQRDDPTTQMATRFRLRESTRSLGSPDWDLDFVRVFFENDWFSRIWCVQEVVLSRKAVILFGLNQQVSQLSWDTVGIAATKLCCATFSYKNQARTHFRIVARNISRMYNANLYPTNELVMALFDFQHYKSTDPRDKIYALLGMVDEGESKFPLVEVDYEKTTRQVYIDAATAILRETMDLSLLSAVGNNTTDVPSWVPCWNETEPRQELRCLNYWSACGERTAPHWRILVDGALLVHGFQFAHVTSSSSEPDFNPVQKPMLQTSGQNSLSSWESTWAPLVFELWQHGHANLYGSAGRDPYTLEKVVAYTLTAGLFENWQPVNASDEDAFLLSFRMATHVLLDASRKEIPVSVETRFTKHGSGPKLPDANLYPALVQEYLHQRKIFYTEGGFFGVGPSSIKEGDKVVVLCGGRVPYILRPVKEGYRFIGACYLHDIMQGEIFEMPGMGHQSEELFSIR